MIGLLIVAVIILLFTFVLFSRINFFAEAEKGKAFKLICSLWSIKLFVLPDTEEDHDKEIKPKSKKSTGKTLESLNIKIKTYDDVVLLLNTIKSILYNVKILIKRIVIKNTELALVVVGNDAADTALKYGAICSATYPILTLLSECFTFKPDTIDISAGFDKKEMEFQLKSEFSVRIIYLLIFAVSSVKEYIKFKKEL